LFTPFLVDLTGAWPAPKESLQNDHTDYAARLHSACHGGKRMTVKSSQAMTPV
jgi:hypothetical protein